ncbi:MAG: DNA utilization protein GntX [Parcubacteria group bacterium ADurb.Bin316]|nr:MAG: DNA utilization protein GntX [Parcubacteria group bacterium ADurb.Bin316]HOZ56481.1 ComF family protein [bacterium]
MTFKYWQNHALYWRDFILDLIFPKECVGCGQEGSWLCPSCYQKLEFSKVQYCLNCKTENNSGEFCPNCRNEYYLDGVTIVGNYDDKIINHLIKMLKYHFIKDVAIILGNYLVDFLQKTHNLPILKITKIPIVIPVPLHKRRRRWRGFNQTKEIAEITAKHFQLKINATNLIRIKHKKAQAKLNEEQRLKNVAGCFAWRGENLTGANIILIDDVVTTGATLNECAKILKQNGASQVWGMVIAKG